MNRTLERDVADVRRALVAGIDAHGPVTRTRPVWPAVGGVAIAGATVAAVIVLAGSPGAGTPDARAAVRDAARELTQATQGVIVLDQSATSEADGSTLHTAHEELRFSGRDIDTDGTNTWPSATEHRLITHEFGRLRVVGGELYVKDTDGPWRHLPPPPGTDAPPAQAVQQVADRAIAGLAPKPTQTLVDAMSDVHATGDDDVFVGTITPDALHRAYGDAEPALVEQLSGDEKAIRGPIDVRVELGDGGTMRTLTLTWHEAWSASAGTATLVSRLDYSGLGQPQQIEAPATR